MISPRILSLILESSRRSLSRQWKHSQERDSAALTPESELTGMTRGTPGVKARRKAFQADLKAKGLGYIKRHGTYEGGHENSYVVYQRNKGGDNGEFRKTIEGLGEKYGQKSILHKSAKERDAKLVGTADNWYDTQGNLRKKGETDNVGRMRFNRREQDGSKPMYRTNMGNKGNKYFDYKKD